MMDQWLKLRHECIMWAACTSPQILLPSRCHSCNKDDEKRCNDDEKMHFKEKCCKSGAIMLKKDVESSLCIYDKAIRSLPLHTSTQRCDRCTCTHAHTHQYSDTIAVFSRCVHTHLLSYIQSLQERTNLHSETIAAAIKSMINHICKGTRSTQSTQIFYINVFPMRHCLSSLVETRLCLSPTFKFKTLSPTYVYSTIY